MAWSPIASSETDANSPLNQTLMDKIRNNIDFVEDITGTRIKILPGDFVTTDYTNAPLEMQGVSGAFIRAPAVAADYMVATYNIPTGYKATHVMVYASANRAVIAYEHEISDQTTATNKGSGNCNTEIDITDITATTTNYMSVRVATDAGAVTDVRGGYITIAIA